MGSTSTNVSNRLRVLELYCGIGGCAAAVGEMADVVAAVDIHRQAIDVYARNFPHPTVIAELESLPEATFHAWEADLWWLSPPCQPYTIRGRQRDLDDPRAASFLRLITRIEEVRPTFLALENVPGFATSRARERLFETLTRTGYSWRELVVCPTEFGVPNRRRRYYLVAARDGQTLVPLPVARQPRELASFLDSQPQDDLLVDPAVLREYESAMHIVEPADCNSVTNCFTSAYGRSPVRSGSYLRTAAGVRRFSPREILRLLGFPESYVLPPDMPPRTAWPLVGNSLSVTVVQAVLSQIGPLSGRFPLP